jgi:hypothetical protein
MAEKKDKKDEPETVAGYSGSQHEGKAAAERPKSVSDAAVVSPLGFTEPGEQEQAVSYKKRIDTDRIYGLCLFEGDTGAGYHRKIILELGAPTTMEAAFNVFKGHFPDAIHDGFKAKAITQDEADKLNAEWAKEQKKG